MESNQERMMLGERFAMDAVGPVVEKNKSGGYEISGFNMLISGLWVFQKGAILGRARADRIEVLAKLVAQEGGEEKMCAFWRSSSEKLLDDSGKRQSSFMDLWTKLRFPSVDLGNMDVLKTLHSRKYRLGEMLPQFQVAAAVGIGLGALYPELVQKMWINAYETDRDRQIWEKARSAGLDIPGKQSHLPLREMEELVLLEVYDFAKDYHPSLIKPLDLNQ